MLEYSEVTGFPEGILNILVLNGLKLSLLKHMLSIKIFPVIKEYAVTGTG